MQDSKTDWTAEASMMSAVYNNAICTIAFVLPPGVSYDSTQCRGDTRTSTPCMIREPTRAARGIIVRPFDIESVVEIVYRGWPLSSRAWTLQEQVLSPRTVFWGDRTIKWECVDIFCDELTGEVAGDYRGHPDFLSNKALLCAQRIYEPNGISPTLSEIEEDGVPYKILQTWAALINRYRRRDLTQASDRIMAFAGIAQAFQAEHGLTYLAGSWKEHLPQSLLWFISDPANSMGTFPSIRQEPVLETAPTWSFFASSIYSNRLDRNKDLRIDWFPETPSGVLFSATLLHFTWPNAPVDSSPPTAYFDFAGLQITLELLTIDCSLSRDLERDDRGYPCRILEAQLLPLFLLKESLIRIYVRFCFDDYGNFDQAPAEVRVALIKEGWDKENGHYYLRGLILEPGVKQNTWRRLGFLNGSARSNGSYFNLWDMVTAEKALPEGSTAKPGEESIFLRLEGAKIETLTLV
ncbi:hypothetical protein AA0120_g2771 [Alternaria tenuissima]|nr:hypothetical protein AA0120_g2771 [Alternaria tenuissima]